MSNLGRMNTTKTPEETRRDIEDVFRKWGIDEYRILPGRINGRQEFKATVKYWLNDKEQELNCDHFYEHRDNLRSLYMILDALRKAQDRGILRELARAAVAMLGPGDIRRPGHEVLGVAPSAPMEVAEAAYRALARSAHPDKGGTHEQMKELNEALAEFKRERDELR